jgi:hypothetical protein
MKCDPIDGRGVVRYFPVESGPNVAPSQPDEVLQGNLIFVASLLLPSAREPGWSGVMTVRRGDVEGQ